MTGFNSTLSRSLGPSVIGVASREMDNLFDRLFYSEGGRSPRSWMPPVSVWEEGKHYHLEMDLPGTSREEIEITFEDGRLKISATRTQGNQNGERRYLHDERWWGEISRSIAVPDSVDVESIHATYRDGVLHVELAKRPEVLPKKIEIAAK